MWQGRGARRGNLYNFAGAVIKSGGAVVKNMGQWVRKGAFVPSFFLPGGACGCRCRGPLPNFVAAAGLFGECSANSLTKI